MYIWYKVETMDKMWVVCNSSFIFWQMISFLCIFLYFRNKSPLILQNTNLKDFVDYSQIAFIVQ